MALTADDSTPIPQSPRAADVNAGRLTLISSNMHGFYQSFPVVDDLIKTKSPDVFLLQEHWVTPANLYLFDNNLVDYFSFGCSAMSNRVDTSMLRGRPFGGAILLINKRLGSITQTIDCDERYAIVKVGNKLLVNVYYTCQGTHDRVTWCEELLTQISSWCEQYNDCDIVFAGDLNCNLDSGDPVSYCVK